MWKFLIGVLIGACVGFIIAGLFAQAIKKQIPALGAAVVKPARVTAEDQNGKTVFTLDSQSRFSCDDEHWTAYAQALVDSIK